MTAGLEQYTALRADNFKKLASQGQIQTPLFDEQNLTKITSEDSPGIRLVVCRNPIRLMGFAYRATQVERWAVFQRPILAGVSFSPLLASHRPSSAAL